MYSAGNVVGDFGGVRLTDSFNKCLGADDGYDRVVRQVDINCDGVLDRIVERPETPGCGGGSFYVLQLHYPDSTRVLEARAGWPGNTRLHAEVMSFSLRFRANAFSTPLRVGDLVSGTGEEYLTRETIPIRGRIKMAIIDIDLSEPSYPVTRRSVRIAGIGSSHDLVTVDAARVTLHKSADTLDRYASDIWKTLKRKQGGRLREALAIIHQRGSVEKLSDDGERQKLKLIGDAVEVELNLLEERVRFDRVARRLVQGRLERRLGFCLNSSYLAAR